MVKIPQDIERVVAVARYTDEDRALFLLAFRDCFPYYLSIVAHFAARFLRGYSAASIKSRYSSLSA